MKPRVGIVAATALTAAGGEMDALWQRLLGADSAIAPVRHFSTAGLAASNAACIEWLEADAGRTRFGHLTDALLDRIRPWGVPPDARLIAATTKGDIEVLERQCRHAAGASPATGGQAWADRLAGRLGLSAPALNVTAACASSTIALALGAQDIVAGRRRAVLVCCADVVSHFVFTGFCALKAVSPSQARPFDRERDGLSLGDGAAALLLMDEAQIRTEGRRVLAWVEGWGIANDAHHVTAPARDGCGLIDACRTALTQAGVAATEVGAVNAHGTGTVYNDLMELKAFQSVFAGRPVPLFSIKGLVGHTLGAAGGVECCVSLHALHAGQVPPTVGCRQPEPTGDAWVCRELRPLALPRILNTNSGFGGINAAILLSRDVR
jgi:3-oxoacyl-[acyl-carrier-protein] synthase II